MVNPMMVVGQRTRPLVYWDAQNLAPSADAVEQYDQFIEQAVKQRVWGNWEGEVFKAWVSQPSGQVAKKLRELGWRVPKSSADCDTAIHHQALSDVGQDPDNTIVFLITRDGDYAGLVEELRNRNVEVYLIASTDASHSLINTVGFGNLIRLPFAGC